MPSAAFILADSQLSLSEVELDPPLPKLPSTSSQHSEAEWRQSLFPAPDSIVMNRLQLSISALSEEKLRNMVLRVAAQDPYFCDVIAMELGDTESFASDADDASPTTPTMTNFPSESREKTPKRRSTRPRTLSKTLVHFPPDIIGATESDQEECHHHPGRLETEDYEFLTMNSEGRPYKVVQTVSMWSCCEGDDTSPGCIIAPAHLFQHQLVQPRHRRARTKSGAYPAKRGYRA